MAKGVKYEPSSKDHQTVKDLSAFNCSQEQIAAYLDIDRKTLAKHHKEDLVVGVVHMVKNAGHTVFKKATNGDLDAAKFILKYRGKWGVVDEESDGKVLQSIAEANKDLIDRNARESIKDERE